MIYFTLQSLSDIIEPQIKSTWLPHYLSLRADVYLL